MKKIILFLFIMAQAFWVYGQDRGLDLRFKNFNLLNRKIASNFKTDSFAVTYWEGNFHFLNSLVNFWP